MEKRIFISHSSKDYEVAGKICEALEENGLKCWIAPRDIPYGTEWAGEIAKAIENSSAFLFLSSGSSNASQQVSREIQLAIENSLAIIPIRLDDAQYSDANKYYLATIHCMIEYDAAKTHKLVSDIMSALPADKEKTAEKKKNVKSKNKNHLLRMLLCSFFSLACAAVFTYVFFFTDFRDVIKYITGAVCVAGVFIPLIVCRKKAGSSYSVNKIKINAVFVAAVVCSASLVTGGYFLDRYLWYSDMDTKYHITLSAPANMTATDFTNAVATVNERFAILMGGERYSFEQVGDTVDIIAPRSAFGEYDPANIIKCYISRAINLSVTTTTYYVGEYEEDYPQLVEVDRSHIKSISVKNGTVEGVDIETLGIESETYDYIELVLDENFVKENASVFEQYGEKLVFAQDKAEIVSNYFYFNTYPGEKDNVYYLVNTDKLENVNEVLIYNYQNPPLASSLNVSVDIAVKWENTAGVTDKGEYQCDSKELEGKTVTFSFVPSVDDISDGEWSDTVNILKERLDVIGEPYAFGQLENNQYSVAVRMGVEKIGIYIFELLTAEKFNVTGSFSYTTVPSSAIFPELVCNESEDGIFVEVTPSYEDKEKDYAALSALACEEGDGRIYLTATYENIPVLSGIANKDSDGKKLVFDSVALSADSPFDSKNMWLARLVEKIYNTPLPADIKVDTYQFDDSATTESDFGFSIGLEEIENAVKELDSECSVTATGKDIKIFFDLPVDENLPQTVIDTAKTVFEKIDFENRNITSLSIYFIEEIDDERARIFFNKTVNSLYRDKDYYKNGGITTYGIFSGGRIQRDNEVFLELIYNDEFFKKYIDEEDGYKDFS